jgi:hypothetical protein
MSWAWCIFAALKKIGAAWLGLVLGLIVGIGCFLMLKAFGTRVILRLKLHEPKLSLGRGLLLWLMCGATLLFAFIAPWGINWFLKALVPGAK